MASVGKHIKQLRTARHMTQEALAEKLFVTRQAVSARETGKALPDVESLEKIAAALDADVTEVIYGKPSIPDPKRQRRRWIAAGAILAIILAVIYIILNNYGYIGTWRYGLRYQFWNLNYAVAFEELPGSYSVELDLNDLESSHSKVLYEDESGCRIIVDYIKEATNSGEYSIVFQAEGVCRPEVGYLVSGCQNERKEKQTYSTTITATMITTVGEFSCSPSYRYAKSSLDENGNFFGFHLFLLDTYDRDRFMLIDELAAEDHIVTVTVTGLTRMTTTRLPRLSPFS